MKFQITIFLFLFSLSLNTSLLAQSNVYNYADSVIAFSSEWTPNSWSHKEVLGHFNTYPCNGDISTAWAASSSSPNREFLELFFENAAPIDSIFIYETFNAGAVDTVYVKNPNTNSWKVVYTATPTNLTFSRILKIGFPKTNFDVSEVRIAIYTEGTYFNEIDAVAINSKPNETADTAFLDCSSTSIEIGSCGSTNIHDATFLWTTSTGNILSGKNTSLATVNAKGLYTLSVMNNGDSVSYDVYVNTDASIPILDAINDMTSCENLTLPLITGNALSGNQKYYTGLNGSGNSYNPGQTINYSDFGSYPVTLYAYDISSASCSDQKSFNITIHSPPSKHINQTLCPGDNITVNGNVYNENNPTGTEILTADSGCDSTVTIDLSFYANIEDTHLNQTLCPGENLIVNGNVYDENNPTGTEILTADSGCDSTVFVNLNYSMLELQDDSYTINTAYSFEALIIENDVLTDNWEVTILESNHPSWFELQEDASLLLPANENHAGKTLTISYQVCDIACNNLCATANVTIFCQKKEEEMQQKVIVSEVLTLNGDGKNDKLFFKGLTNTNEGIAIYNRWGSLIFTQAPYLNKWDGKNLQGEDVVSGTYYYILNIDLSNGDFIKGNVLIVR